MGFRAHDSKKLQDVYVFGVLCFPVYFLLAPDYYEGHHVWVLPVGPRGFMRRCRSSSTRTCTLTHSCSFTSSFGHWEPSLAQNLHFKVHRNYNSIKLIKKINRPSVPCRKPMKVKTHFNQRSQGSERTSLSRSS